MEVLRVHQVVILSKLLEKNGSICLWVLRWLLIKS